MQNIFIDFLPPWVETGLQPAFYDKESGTVLQQVARMYAKVNQLVKAFDDLDEATVSTVNEYITKFTELHDYVHDYFDNLDVQEEINNKLDEMAEDGTLTTLISNYLIYPSNLNVNELVDLVIADSDTYAGAEHNHAQGSVCIGSNIVVALRNNGYSDNYVRLVEYNYTTGVIIRQSYLELDHANAMTYDSTNNVIYVASCSTSVDNTSVAKNTIYVIDYATFSILRSFTPTLPDGRRIRSVSYDNASGTLYGADVFDVFKIDETTLSTSDDVELEHDSFMGNILNQTVTFHNNRFYGLFITFIGIWDLQGNLIKIIDINNSSNLQHYGEVESLTFIPSTDDFVMVSSKKYNPRQSNRVTAFYVGNFAIGRASQLENTVAGADSSNIRLYVDASATGEEMGTEAKPFKSIAKAISYAKEWNKGADIFVSAGTYDYVYVNSLHNITLNFQNANVTINGFEVREGDVYCMNNTNTVINDLLVTQHSRFKFGSGTINAVNKNNAVEVSEASIVELNDCAVNAKSGHEAIYANVDSTASLQRVTFDGYTGTNAIYATACSRLNLYNCVFNIAGSGSAKTIRLNGQSYANCDPTFEDSINWQISGQSAKNPSIYEITLDNPVFVGNICDWVYGFTTAQIKIKTIGTNSGNYEFKDLDMNDADGCVINSVWANGNGLRIGSIRIQKNNNKLQINSNRMGFVESGGNITYEEYTSTPPATTQNYICVVGVKFYNK